MYKEKKYLVMLSALLLSLSSVFAQTTFTIESESDWNNALEKSEGVSVKDGRVVPDGKTGLIRSKLQRYNAKQKLQSITVGQSPVWENWEPLKSLGPANLGNAPVMVCVGPDNYWMFGRYDGARNSKNFKPQTAKLDGFDVPLQTTPFKNQYNAPGGLMPSLGGYHAWQSRDMLTWVHHGPVSESYSKWVTTAEYVDGKLYLYYDYPNDMDPYLYIDDNLFDGKPGKNMGLVFKDPSYGSDCAVIRSLDGKFHIISEDWSPISANNHSWDSPLASHAVSKDGIKDFKILPPAVDYRTTPTGKIEAFKMHSNQNPASYPQSPFPGRLPAREYKFAKYEVHEPKQDAYGDWASISIGGQYYLFGDYHPSSARKGSSGMSTAWFTAASIDEPFKFCGNIGKGHPDPDIGFAEGRFYLISQTDDFVSDGPWVEKVEVRIGVDTTNDGESDSWSDWQEIKEKYDYIKGFSKQVKRIPAAMDVSTLPEGYGFCFELRLEDTTENKSKPIIDSITMTIGLQ
ncbi:hypothetical protein PQO01_09350 [Lentisphaera marina]|uniref:hypothetical protein n=1 Tax=Lentisphaera marina TaxID=1111041 RepID=UPI002365FE57|nr:hypothetical protein [Lentisphaera marina]MDD7985154.1 hypothetical protein [Lentisphaera marina]